MPLAAAPSPRAIACSTAEEELCSSFSDCSLGRSSDDIISQAVAFAEGVRRAQQRMANTSTADQGAGHSSEFLMDHVASHMLALGMRVQRSHAGGAAQVRACAPRAAPAAADHAVLKTITTVMCCAMPCCAARHRHPRLHTAARGPHRATARPRTHTCAAAQGGCTSLHGIMRAPQADGKESIVLVTPTALTPGPDRGDAPPGGAPLVLGAVALLLSHLRSSPHAGWLAKDLIWVVPDARCEGSLAALEAWARAYQVRVRRLAWVFWPASIRVSIDC